MKARFSTTTILFLSLSGLLTWYVVYEKQIKVTKTAEEQNSKKLVQFSRDDIQEMDITHGTDSPFKLKRSGNDWILTAPIEDTADAGVINSLLTTLTSSEEERVVDEEPKNLEVFGLEKPALTIRVAKDASSSQDILVGSQTQVGFSVYVRTSSSKQVFKTNRALLSSFQKNLFELRNKNLVPLKKGELTEVEIHNSSSPILVHRNSKDQWVLGSDGGPADTTEWGKILNALIDLKAIAVASEKAELASYRLDKPILKVWLSEGPEKAKLGLFFSKVKDKVFAKRDDKPLIYEVDNRILKELSKDASLLKDSHLVTFNRFAVNRIKLTRGAQVVEIKKDGPTWTFVGADNNPQLDPGKLEKFLTTLQDAKASAFTSKKLGATPAVMIELFETKEGKEVSVARVNLIQQKTGEAMGTSDHLNGAWTIGEMTFKQLNLTQDDFIESTPKVEEKKS